MRERRIFVVDVVGIRRRGVVDVQTVISSNCYPLLDLKTKETKALEIPLRRSVLRGEQHTRFGEESIFLWAALGYRFENAERTHAGAGLLRFASVLVTIGARCMHGIASCTT